MEVLASASSLKQPSVFVIGNPLLDMSIEASDELFEKWGIKPSQITLANEKQLALFEELKQMSGLSYVAGGSAQNTARGVQWLLPNASTTYVGAVGKDDASRVLKDTAEKAGLNLMYFETEKDVTGTCAVLIKDSERSLIANIAACNHLDPNFLDYPLVVEKINQANVIYCTGYILTTPQGLGILLNLAKHCQEYNKTFIFNLSASFLLDIVWDKIQTLLFYADIVIGNEIEGDAYAAKLDMEGDLEEAALYLSTQVPFKCARPRTVIFTQGPNPTIVARNGSIQTYEPIKVAREQIVDLNGAGDAFVSGIVSGIAKGTVDFDECIRASHYAANRVILNSGAVYPYPCEFNWSS